MSAYMTRAERAEFVTAYRAGLADAVAGRRYSTPLPPGMLSEAYAGGWGHGLDVSSVHATAVRTDGGHGYPYRAHCTCGWRTWGYVAAHAAHGMADAHIVEIASR
jgi:hypothetical protein